MAWNNNNRGGGNGGNNFNKPKTMSVSFDTFWSSDTFAQGNGEYQSVKLGLYGSKVALNFTKGSNNAGKAQTAYLSMDFETAVVVCNTLRYIRNMRRKAFSEGTSDSFPLWSFKNSIQFTDKDTKQLRTIGIFEISTEVSPITNKNTVYIKYSAGTDEWKIALGSTYIKDQVDYSTSMDFDPSDSRFDAFVIQFEGLIRNYPVVLTLAHMTGIMMNNFTPIRNKLGVQSKSYNGGGGNYTDNNYHSGGSNGGELPPPPDDMGSDGAGF